MDYGPSQIKLFTHQLFSLGRGVGFVELHLGMIMFTNDGLPYIKLFMHQLSAWVCSGCGNVSHGMKKGLVVSLHGLGRFSSHKLDFGVELGPDPFFYKSLTMSFQWVVFQTHKIVLNLNRKYFS